MAVIAEIDSATTGQAAPTAWDAVLTQVRAREEFGDAMVAFLDAAVEPDAQQESERVA